MNSNRVLMLIGGALLLAAVVLGLTGVSTNGRDCGSAFGDSSRQDLVGTLNRPGLPGASPAACADARSGRRTLTVALGLPALLLLGFSAGMESRAAADRRPPQRAG